MLTVALYALVLTTPHEAHFGAQPKNTCVGWRQLRAVLAFRFAIAAHSHRPREAVRAPPILRTPHRKQLTLATMTTRRATAGRLIRHRVTSLHSPGPVPESLRSRSCTLDQIETALRPRRPWHRNRRLRLFARALDSELAHTLALDAVASALAASIGGPRNPSARIHATHPDTVAQRLVAARRRPASAAAFTTTATASGTTAAAATTGAALAVSSGFKPTACAAVDSSSASRPSNTIRLRSRLDGRDIRARRISRMNWR